MKALTLGLLCLCSNLCLAQEIAPPKTTCSYDSQGEFTVVTDNQRFLTRMVRSYNDGICAASAGSASLYDGDQFWIFARQTQRFISFDVADTFAQARLSTGENISLLYDGSHLTYYNNLRQEFKQEKARDNYPQAAVIAGKNGALSYDGDHLRAFCIVNKENTDGDFNFSVAENALAIGMIDKNGRPILLVGEERFTLDEENCLIQKL